MRAKIKWEFNNLMKIKEIKGEEKKRESEDEGRGIFLMLFKG